MKLYEFNISDKNVCDKTIPLLCRPRDHLSGHLEGALKAQVFCQNKIRKAYNTQTFEMQNNDANKNSYHNTRMNNGKRNKQEHFFYRF